MTDQREKPTEKTETPDHQRPKRESEPPAGQKSIAPEKVKRDVEDDDRFQATDN